MSDAPRQSVPSRELGAYVATLSMQLGAVESYLALLGVESPNPDAVERLSDLARWLQRADFTVEDPWPYQYVCREIVKLTEPGQPWTPAETLNRLRAMAQAALNHQSLLEFMT